MVEIKRTNFNGYNGSHFTLILCYEILSQGLVNSKPVTKLQYKLYMSADSVSAGAGSASTGYINGSAVGSVTSISRGETKLIGTLDVSIQHNDAGVFPNTNYSASMSSLWNGLGSASLSGTLTSANIPSIAVASIPTATSGNIGENIIIYTNRKSTSYLHILKWAFGSLSGNINSSPYYVTDSIQWKLPNSLYTQIPNASYGNGTITCETYHSGKLIGTKTCSFTAYANEAQCKPTVTMDVIDTSTKAIELTGNALTLIKYVSNPKITMGAVPKNSATISSKKIECGDGKLASNQDEVTFAGVQSNYFKATATDSRGFSNYKEMTLTMIQYINLTCTAEASRVTQTGDKVRLTAEGYYFNGSFGAVDNTLEVKVRSREVNTQEWSTWETLTPTITDDHKYTIDQELTGSFNYKKYYEFEVVATDKIGSVQAVMQTLNAGIPIQGLFEKFIEMWGERVFELVEEEE